MIDWIQGERFMELADGAAIVYRHTHDVNKFFKTVTVDAPFILISHNSDGCIMSCPDREDHADINLAPSNLVHWFGQNVNVIDPRVSSIPLGLENDKWLSKTPKTMLMRTAKQTPPVIKNLLYVNHNIATNPAERQAPYQIFDGKSWVTLQHGKNGAGFTEYLNQLYSHKFILCPQGHGIDTVRTWEALYMGVIPVEKRNLNNRFYTDLPICFVNNWEEITEDFLNAEYERIKSTEWNMEKLKFSYWKDKILGYHE